MNQTPSSRWHRGLLGTLSFGVVLYFLVSRSDGSLSRKMAINPLDEPAAPVAIVIGAFVLVILLNGVFVAAEAAVEGLKASHVRHVRETNEANAKNLQMILDQRLRYAAACALGAQLARLSLVLVGLLMAQDLAISLANSDGWNYSFRTILISAILVAIPVGLTNLVFGHLVPRSYADLHPGHVVTQLLGPIRFAALVFSVPAGLIVSVANVLTRRFGGLASLSTNKAEVEIRNLVETAQETGEIEEDERDLLDSVFEFTDTVAREVMTPRVDLDAVSVTSDPAEVVRIIRETGHSRIPLFEETDDQIVGIVHAKDLLMAMVGDRKRTSLKRLMRAPLFVPENKNLHDLLTEMRAHRAQMAIVQDDFGGTAGIVTIEDIVEELVGDIVDEYDVDVQSITEIEGGWLIDGRTNLDDVNDEIESEIESEGFDTIGGYVFGLFGRQPKVAESIAADGFTFEVAQTDGKRIQSLIVRAAPDVVRPIDE